MSFSIDTISTTAQTDSPSSVLNTVADTSTGDESFGAHLDRARAKSSKSSDDHDSGNDSSDSPEDSTSTSALDDSTRDPDTTDAAAQTDDDSEIDDPDDSSTDELSEEELAAAAAVQQPSPILDPVTLEPVTADETAESLPDLGQTTTPTEASTPEPFLPTDIPAQLPPPPAEDQPSMEDLEPAETVALPTQAPVAQATDQTSVEEADTVSDQQVTATTPSRRSVKQSADDESKGDVDSSEQDATNSTTVVDQATENAPPTASADAPSETDGRKRDSGNRKRDHGTSVGSDVAAAPVAQLPAADTPSETNSNEDPLAAVNGTSDSDSQNTSSVATQDASQTSTQASQSTDSTQESGGDDAQAGQVDRSRFVQRVAKAFEAMGERSGSVRVRLSPPELGSVRLDVTYRNGTVSAHVQAETTAARDVLLDNLPALRERLSQQDIKIDRFDVDLADPSLNGSSQQNSNNQWDSPSPRQSTSTRQNDSIAADTSPSTEVERIVGENGSLNVLV
jgi:flagellar hook-length control protein FliK